MLTLPGPLLRRLREHCEGRYPLEACGLLLGRVDGRRRVVEVCWPGRNREAERPGERFELDPEDLIAAEAAARAMGKQIVGVYHSHPDRSEEPSRRDHQVAVSGWTHLIVSVHGDGHRGEAGAVAAWQRPAGELRGELQPVPLQAAMAG